MGAHYAVEQRAVFDVVKGAGAVFFYRPVRVAAVVAFFAYKPSDLGQPFVKNVARARYKFAAVAL